MTQEDETATLKIPDGLLGRFGVIKLWPDIQVAEDEVIARLVNASKLLGLECIVLDHMGRRLPDKGLPMTGDDLDFVIHLHFSTPKSYDIFSFMTLWNPPKFFHDFGYRPMIENILTHDDYLSCKSPGADLHLRRLIEGDRFHLPPKFDLFHSLATPVLPPTLGELKLFYMGINWERLGESQSRHENVLNLLDATGLLRIYGPDVLLGVKVWDGFQSYQSPLPFDGVSVINEIHRAGICLALSSPAHKDAGLMSNRLFEGLAAGALIVCDEKSLGAHAFWRQSALRGHARWRADRRAPDHRARGMGARQSGGRAGIGDPRAGDLQGEIHHGCVADVDPRRLAGAQDGV